MYGGEVINDFWLQFPTKKTEGRESEKQMVLFKVQVFFFKSL